LLSLAGFLDVGFAVIDPNHLGYNDTNTMKNPFMTNVTGTTPPPLVCRFNTFPDFVERIRQFDLVKSQLSHGLYPSVKTNNA